MADFVSVQTYVRSRFCRIVAKEREEANEPDGAGNFFSLRQTLSYFEQSWTLISQLRSYMTLAKTRFPPWPNNSRAAQDVIFLLSLRKKKLEPCYFLLSCDPWGENPVNKKVERIFFILEQKSKLCSVINRQPCLRRGLKEDGCYRNSKLQFPSVKKQGIFWTSKTYSITSGKKTFLYTDYGGESIRVSWPLAKPRPEKAENLQN